MLKSFTFGLLSEDDLRADPLRSGQHSAKEIAELYGDNPPKFLEQLQSDDQNKKD